MPQFKSEKLKQNLALFDGKHIIVSLFNTSLAAIDTKMSELEVFIKKSRTKYISTEEDNQPVCLDLRLHKGLVFAYYMHFVKVHDFANGMACTQVL